MSTPPPREPTRPDPFISRDVPSAFAYYGGLLLVALACFVPGLIALLVMALT